MGTRRVGGAPVASCLWVAAASLVPHATAWAAEELGEIVVSAQKREQKLQDVAMSIAALGGERLQELGITSGIDIVAQVPGVQVSGAGGGTVNAFNIRGVTQNAFAANLESPIAVYLDESYLALNSGIDLSLFDVERVEVLRGPQGTLFGRNATGGVVRYVTARPSQSAEGKVGVELGEDGRVRLEGAAGGPLSDSVAFRFSGALNRDDGLIENDRGRNAMKSDDWAIRAQALFQGESLDGWLKLQYVEEDSNRGGYAHVLAQDGEYVTSPTATDFWGYRDADGDPFTASLDFPGWNRNEFADVTATLDWSLGRVTLTSVSNYQNLKNDYAEDADVTPFSVYHYVRTADVDQFSQELRASWQTERLTGLVGVYFLRIDGVYGTEQFGEVYFGTGREIASADQVTTSYAVFGQAEIAFSDRASVELGARYSSDSKDFAYRSTNLFEFVAPGPVSFERDFSDDGVSARVQFNSRPVDGRLWYVGVNRGIKSGGLNFPLFPQEPELLRFDGEVLTAYEGGVKTSLGAAATLNVSVFRYDYDDYQAFSFDGLATRVVNVNAEMTGGEIEFQASPVAGLDVSLGMSYLSNEVRDVPLAVSDGTERAPFAPKWTVNGLVRYGWSAFGGELSAQLDGSWRDKQNFNLVPTPVLEEPAYAVLNARIGFSSADDRWSAALFVRNLADEEYRFYSFDTSLDFGALEDIPGVGRWFGASFGYRW
ncbi:MAG: TonB-dependent receptor [Pseudomonadota bacterium]